MIDELLNLELYRREFQFKEPKFPPDEEEDEGDEVGEEDAFDKTLVINGENGGHIEIRDGSS